jgi:hypothetical protein
VEGFHTVPRSKCMEGIVDHCVRSQGFSISPHRTCRYQSCATFSCSCRTARDGGRNRVAACCNCFRYHLFLEWNPASRFRHSPSRHSSVASSESAGLDQKYHGRCMRIRPCRQMTRAALCVFVCVPWRCDGGRCCCYLWEPCGAWTAADSHLGLGCHPEGGDPTRAKLWLAAKPASSGEAKGCGREEIQHAGWAQGKGILAAGIANAELRHSA